MKGKISVGDGITRYRREKTLYDDGMREKVFSGDHVPADLRKDTTRPWLNLRSDLERYCQKVFEEHGLPNPLSLIHDELPTIEWHIALHKGAQLEVVRSV